MMTVRVVTDSTSDIPEEIAQQMGIRIVPNIMVLDGQSLVDGKDITRQDFYTRLPEMKSLPTTGTASTGAYLELYEQLFSEGASHIFSMHTAGLLSGILNAATAAAQTFEDRVSVWDSRSVSMGLGFQVLAAAEAAATGATPQAILQHLEEIRPRSRVVAMLDTLEYVRRSGRVSWARAGLGNLLRIKPFIEVKGGVVHSLGEVRTRRKGIEKLAELLKNQGPLDRLAIVHTNAEAEAHQFVEMAGVHLTHPSFVVNVTPIIGTHVGPNALGYACVLR